MKTLITYYGGKQKLVSWISRYIPKHKCYIEPFAGGLALFFGRPKIKGTIEVINDINSMVTNFWKQLRDNNDELHRLLDNTLYSREDFLHCRDIYNKKKEASDMEKARAFFVVNNFSFACGGKNFSSSGYRRINKRANSFAGKLKSIKFLNDKMRNVCIENQCALVLIKRMDSDNSFFYCDPPYPMANQGPYKGYNLDDFNKLLTVLKTIKGKFILSCYIKDGMDLDVGWRVVKKTVKCIVEGIYNGGKRSERTECLIMNF